MCLRMCWEYVYMFVMRAAGIRSLCVLFFHPKSTEREREKKKKILKCKYNIKYDFL